MATSTPPKERMEAHHHTSDHHCYYLLSRRLRHSVPVKQGKLRYFVSMNETSSSNIFNFKVSVKIIEFKIVRDSANKQKSIDAILVLIKIESFGIFIIHPFIIKFLAHILSTMIS